MDKSCVNHLIYRIFNLIPVTVVYRTKIKDETSTHLKPYRKSKTWSQMSRYTSHKVVEDGVVKPQF